MDLRDCDDRSGRKEDFSVLSSWIFSSRFRKTVSRRLFRFGFIDDETLRAVRLLSRKTEMRRKRRRKAQKTFAFSSQFAFIFFCSKQRKILFLPGAMLRKENQSIFWKQRATILC
jgi:hypothetical protein